MAAARLGVNLGAILTMLAWPASMPAAPATMPAERIASPVLAGFVLGYQAANAAQSIREEIPRGETVERWSRMVTTQRFTGLAARSSPAAYARTITGSVPQACPGAAISPIASIAVSGRAAARFQVDCPRNQYGQVETFILIAIAGQSDMHVKQVAFRGAKSPADLAWARTYLDRTVLCRPRDPQVGCR
jgi:hypothetical protein